MTSLHVCIVTFQNEATIGKCLDAARRALPAETRFTVVDNASEDRTVVCAKGRLTGYDRLLVADRNVGFGAAMNHAIRLVDEDWVLLLNPDAFLHPSFGELLSQIQVPDGVAVIAPEITTPYGRQPTPSPLPSVWMALLEFSGAKALSRVRAVRLLAPFLGPTIASHLGRVNGRRQSDLAFVAATALILRRAAYQRVGGFDESYFLYAEDADLCRALVSAGWRVQYEPSLGIQHLVGGSSKNFRKERVEAIEGILWYWEKSSPMRRKVVQSMAVINATAKLLSQLRNPARRELKRQLLVDLYRWQPSNQERHRVRAAAASYHQIALI